MQLPSVVQVLVYRIPLHIVSVVLVSTSIHIVVVVRAKPDVAFIRIVVVADVYREDVVVQQIQAKQGLHEGRV